MVPARRRMQKENNNGPITEPCGTPTGQGGIIREELVHPNRESLVRGIYKQEENQCNTEPERPARNLSLLSKIL